MGKLQPLEESSIRKTRPCNYLFRSVAANVRAHVTRSTPEACARALFGRDVVTDLILQRAASGPATTTTTGWADSLARLAIEDLIAAVASLSAGADLINRGTLLPFDGFASIRVPGRSFAANNADAGQWVAEGAAIPVRALAFTNGVVLSPHKVAVMVVFSREQAESSAIEQISRAMISEAVAQALDAALFSNFAGDTTRPPGLLQTAAITATAGGGTQAMMTDLGALVEALALAHGGKNIVFIVAPKQAVTMKAALGPLWDYPIIASAALAAGTVSAIELASLVSAFAPDAEFKMVPGASIVHLEDTSPTQITGGTPSPAVPVKSLYQVDAIGLRMVLRASFGMRAAGHAQVIQGATW
jgi:hypothetical protein